MASIKEKRSRRKRGDYETISPNTVLKWSRCLQSSFESLPLEGGTVVGSDLDDASGLLFSAPGLIAGKCTRRARQLPPCLRWQNSFRRNR
jgi:hypothetical protein